MADPATRLEIWDPNRQVVFEQRVEGFAQRWKEFGVHFDIGPGKAMYYLLAADQASAEWFKLEREFIRGIAVGLGLDPEDLQDLAKRHGLPDLIFNLHNQ